MLNFIQLGNGSALNPEMTNSSFLVKGSDKYILVDCGYNVFTELFKNKDILNNITHICITHMDDDHIGSLRALMYHLFFKQNVVPTIICDKSIEFQLKTYLLDHAGTVKDYAKVPTKLFELIALETNFDFFFRFENKNIAINTFANKHYQSGSGFTIVDPFNHSAVSITGDTIACYDVLAEYNRCKDEVRFAKYKMYHDYSNWNEPDMNVHACSSNIVNMYPNKMIDDLCFYHNDAVISPMKNMLP